MNKVLTATVLSMIMGAQGCRERNADSSDTTPAPPVSTQPKISNPESVKKEPNSELPPLQVIAQAKSLVLYINPAVFLKNNGLLQRLSYLQNGKWMTYPELDKKSGYLSVHYPVTDLDIKISEGRYPIKSVTTPTMGTLLIEPENAQGMTMLEVSIPNVKSDAVNYEQFVEVAKSQFKLSLD